MKYKEAMAIGSSVDGLIKCTWAKVYDAEGNVVYALQNRNFSKQTTYAGAYYEGEDSMVSKNNVDLNLAVTTGRIFEAVCTCSRYVDGYRVPVKLSASVQRAFRQTIENEMRKLQRLSVYAQGDAEYRLKQSIALRKKQLADMEAGKEFWVKVKAMEWYPLNTKGVSLEAQEAEAELKKAKQLLAASAALTAI